MTQRHRYILAHERAELEREARQYMLTALLVIAALVLLAVVGHSFVSARVASGQMPVIFTDTFLPTISTGETK